MKLQTQQEKLLALLGLDHLKEKLIPDSVPKSKKGYNKFEGIPEERIQAYREAQGIIYFLQAPKLFTLKECPHCGDNFLVSRQFVALCSYTCIAKDLEARGFQWSLLNDDGTYEILPDWLEKIYEGNEPIWIKNLNAIRKVLDPL